MHECFKDKECNLLVCHSLLSDLEPRMQWITLMIDSTIDPING